MDERACDRRWRHEMSRGGPWTHRAQGKNGVSPLKARDFAATKLVTSECLMDHDEINDDEIHFHQKIHDAQR